MLEFDKLQGTSCLLQWKHEGRASSHYQSSVLGLLAAAPGSLKVNVQGDLASKMMEKRHNVGYDAVTYLYFAALTVYAASP